MLQNTRASSRSSFGQQYDMIHDIIHESDRDLHPPSQLGETPAPTESTDTAFTSSGNCESSDWPHWYQMADNEIPDHYEGQRLLRL